MGESEPLVARMLEALKPFAGFYEALREMGGPRPKSGTFYALESSQVGVREITVEDFAAAFEAIAAAERYLDPKGEG